jgi:methyl-accepting chemotaxis protein
MAGVLLDQMPAVGSRIHLKEVRGRIIDDWTAFKRGTKDNAFSDDAKKQIEKIDKQIVLLPAFLDKLNEAYANEQKTLITPLLEDEWPSFHAGLIKPISLLLPEQQLAVKQTYEKSKADGNRLVIVGIAIFSISLLLLTLFGWRVLASINRGFNALQSAFSQIAQGNLLIHIGYDSQDEFGQMAKSLEATASRLQQIVASVKSAAESAVQHSASLSEQVEVLIASDKQFSAKVTTVAANMEEITFANSEVAVMANSAADAVNRNEELARSGNANVTENMTVIGNVVNIVNDSVSIVGQLNTSIQKIGQIAIVIKEIADQTNLLALNAAIEAARAGEQGRGFAVVADEVRKLAERTSSSTQEISGVINSIRTETDSAVVAMNNIESEVKKGVHLSEMTGEVLQKIVAAASNATQSVGNIVSSTKDQASVTENVAHNLQDISAVSEQNESSIQHVGRMADEVAKIAAELQDIVEQFKV